MTPETLNEAIDPYKKCGVATTGEINRDLDAAVRRVNNFPMVKEGILSTNCRDAEDIVTIYGALRTYLKVLSQQPEEDLETIARVTRLMIAIKPQAVEASQEIARKGNNGA